MIPDEKLKEVERLLLERKLTHRQIAELTGLSRGQVGRIYRGKLPKRRLPPPSAPADPLGPQSPPERCPTCGAMVYMPCVACRVRAILARRRRRREQGRRRMSCSGEP